MHIRMHWQYHYIAPHAEWKPTDQTGMHAIWPICGSAARATLQAPLLGLKPIFFYRIFMRGLLEGNVLPVT